MAPSSLTRFQHLPLELREMIWKRALPEPRTLRIEVHLNFGNANDVSLRCLGPLLHTLLVCPESRKITLAAFRTPIYCIWKDARGKTHRETQWFNQETEAINIVNFDKLSYNIDRLQPSLLSHRYPFWAAFSGRYKDGGALVRTPFALNELFRSVYHLNIDFSCFRYSECLVYKITVCRDAFLIAHFLNLKTFTTVWNHHIFKFDTQLMCWLDRGGYKIPIQQLMLYGRLLAFDNGLLRAPPTL